MDELFAIEDSVDAICLLTGIYWLATVKAIDSLFVTVSWVEKKWRKGAPPTITISKKQAGGDQGRWPIRRPTDKQTSTPFPTSIKGQRPVRQKTPLSYNVANLSLGSQVSLVTDSFDLRAK